MPLTRCGAGRLRVQLRGVTVTGAKVGINAARDGSVELTGCRLPRYGCTTDYDTKYTEFFGNRIDGQDGTITVDGKDVGR